MLPGHPVLAGIAAVLVGIGAGWSARLWSEPSDSARFEAAEIDRAAGRMDSAVQRLLGISGDSPLAAEARAALGLTQLASGQVDAAERALRLAVSDRSDLQPARDELRWLYFNTFRVRDVERLVEAWLELRPDDYRALLDLHFAEFRRQLPREGRPYLEQLESQQPGQLAVLRGLAWCDWQSGDARAARERFAAALDRDPRDLETGLLAAEFALEQGWPDLCRDLLTLSDEAGRVAAEADDRWWGLRGREAREAGRPDEALSLLDQAIQLRPRESAWLQERGLALRELGRKEEAAAALQRAVRLEQVRSEMADLVFSGRLEKPDRDTLDRMASLCEERGQQAALRCWRLWSGRAQAATGMGRP